MKHTSPAYRPRLPTEEGPNAPPLRSTQETQLERLKQRLLRELLEEASARPDLNLAYRRAAEDASSLAWLTPFPLLFLPALLGEKAAEARARANYQRALLTRAARSKAVA